ncbi:MAG: response regulator [Polyangiaceae bacterium]|nr:response regulator [Polyangiaceae bacterium]
MNTQLKVLLIDDEALVRDELGGLLTDEGYELTTASDGESGLACFRSVAPDMVISDVRMPRRDGLSIAMAIRQEAPTIPITVISGHGSEAMVLQALRAGVTDFIKKPVRLDDLTNALRRMESALRLARTQGGELPPTATLQEQSWVYEIENDLSAVPRFVDVIMHRADLTACPRTTGELCIALRELIINAIEHGNLRLSYEEKSQALESGTLEKIIAERQLLPEFKNRTTSVRVQRRGSSITISIADQGRGFDWRKLPDPTDGSNLLADHGRGILLARMAVDELTYNDEGNVAYLTKTLR